MIVSGAFAGRHYAVLGLARSGLASVAALVASGARVTAWDADPAARAAAPAGADIADLDRADLSVFDSLVVSPGVALNRLPLAKRADDCGVEIIGDIELFARARNDLPAHQLVAITGTNGKSTTTALVHHILVEAGVPTTMAGNIGLPILAQEPLAEGGVYVLELSSYQIDLTKSLDCDVAVLLNITPDHLDRYADFDAYARSKQRLFEMQSAEHLGLLNEGDIETDETMYRLHHDGKPAGRLQSFHGAEVEDWPRSAALAGWHNASNAAAAVAAVRALGGIDEVVIERALMSFAGLAHRMEVVRVKDGVTFVNDSKATNVEAAAPALDAYRRVRWIVGGEAKAAGLGPAANALGRVVKAYAIGEAGPMFAQAIAAAGVEVERCATIDVAVARAARDACPGDTVLLSPAAASFDQFRNFEERGDAFRTLVEAL